jgi:hypothetical protein
LISFIDSLFNGPIQLLQSAINFLSRLANVAATGINVNNYFGWFGVLDPAFQRVINSILASLAFIAILFIVRAVYRIYLSLKAGIKWW